jgi:hypothetical protein
MICESGRFCGAGVPPAGLFPMLERKAAGETPAPRNPVLYRDALERGAIRTVRGRTSGVGE